MFITPTPGVTYYFTFEPDYSARTGIYTLVKLMTYDEYLADGGDLMSDVFSPVNKTEEDMMHRLEEIKSSKMMKLITPDTLDETTTIFMPLAFVVDTPDHNVKKYVKLGLVTYIGVTDDPDLLAHVKESITEHIAAATGIDSDPKFVAIGETWMTQRQYEEILAGRDEEKKKIINYYSENIKLEKRIAALQDRLNAYEEIIISHCTDKGTGG